jgi:integrase
MPGGSPSNAAGVQDGYPKDRRRASRRADAHRRSRHLNGETEIQEAPRSIATLLAFGGLRIGEMLALRWKDVDFESNTIRIRQSVYEGTFDEPKSQRSKRGVRLGPTGMEVLKARKPAECNLDALVFATRLGTPLSRRNLLNRQLKPTCEKLGLKGVTWHWFRHANATLHCAVGTPLGTIQNLLGHSSPQITSEVYVHSVPAEAVCGSGLQLFLIKTKHWTVHLEPTFGLSDVSDPFVLRMGVGYSIDHLLNRRTPPS